MEEQRFFKLKKKWLCQKKPRKEFKKEENRTLKVRDRKESALWLTN